MSSALSIIAARIDRFRTTPDCNLWSVTTGSGSQVSAVFHSGFYRLSRNDIPMWDGTDPEDVVRIGECIVRDVEDRAAWEAMEFSHLPLHIEGLGLTVEIRKVEGCGAEAIVIDRDDAVVGRYSFRRTPWPGSYVIGEQTIDGSVYLDEKYWGKGVCRALYDAVELTVGMPVVPHGRNGVQGELTPMSDAFWRKRYKERRVPGHHDKAAARRLSEVREGTKFILAEDSMMTPEFAVGVAELTGWRILGVASSDEGIPRAAWCVTPDGRRFTSTGFALGPSKHDGSAVREYDAVELAARLHGTFRDFFFADLDKARKDAALILERYAGAQTSPAVDLRPPSLIRRLPGM